MGPQAGLDTVKKRKISANAGNQTLDIQPTVNHSTAILKISVSASQKHTVSLLQKPTFTAVYRNNHALFCQLYKHIHALFGQNEEFPNVYTCIHTVTAAISGIG